MKHTHPDRKKTRFNRKLKCGLPMYDGIVGSDGRALPNPTAYFAFRKPLKTGGKYGNYREKSVLDR